MTVILTAAEMRALEQAAVASGEVTGLELMERAGRGVVEAILAEWPDIEAGAKRAVVLCGPGNNGGDGFVVARLLKKRGWAVEVFLYGDAETLPPDARANCERWAAIGPLAALTRAASVEFSKWPEDRVPSVWIDALFGIGLSRQVNRDVNDAFSFLVLRDDQRTKPARIVAVDVPSGLRSDDGCAFFEPPPAVWGVPTLENQFHFGGEGVPLLADLTVTFEAAKIGHFVAEGPKWCGRLKVVDIGLRATRQSGRTRLVEPEKGWTIPGGWGVRKLSGHKYGYGHAVLLSGGAGKGGAARLAARGALRIGSGLVTLAVPPAALQENAAALDAVMLRSVKGPEALTDLLADPRLNALCVGPGFGTGERQAAMLAALLDAARGAGASDAQPAKPRPTVLDADALTLLAKDPALRAKLHDTCVLTPHEGEFARLFPEIDAKWRAPATAGPAFSKVDAAREAAREAGCVVLIKGPDTVIADPTGRAAINAAVYDRAAPWLATAGSGDVLAGFITGLLARGFPPFDAACTAAWLHVECARSFGPGLIAEDLPEELPKVFRALGL